MPPCRATEEEEFPCLGVNSQSRYAAIAFSKSARCTAANPLQNISENLQVSPLHFKRYLRHLCHKTQWMQRHLSNFLPLKSEVAKKVAMTDAHAWLHTHLTSSHIEGGGEERNKRRRRWATNSPASSHPSCTTSKQEQQRRRRCLSHTSVTMRSSLVSDKVRAINAAIGAINAICQRNMMPFLPLCFL